MKRIVSLLLLAALLCSSLLFAGCPSNDPGTGGGGGGDGEQIIDYGVGEHNYNGDEVKISCFSLFEYEMFAEEDSSEFVDDAIYKRNARVEQAFNLELESVVSIATGPHDLETHYSDVLRYMNSGENVFDILAMYAYQAGKLVLRGELFDLRSELVPYVSKSINEGAEWWPAQINIDCTVNGAQFLAVSDLCLTAMEMVYVVAFNKDMEEDENIAEGFQCENLYQMVDRNLWTLDNFYNIVKDRHDDSPTGADGRDETDTYGLVVGGGTDSDAWAYSLGFKYTKNDGELTPELWDWNMGIVNAIEDLRELYNANGVWKQWGDEYSKRTEFFANGRAIFNLTTLLELKTDYIHNMESEFGVLPYPKMSSTQKMYKTGTMDHYTMLAISTTIGMGEPLERTCVALEALSVDSNKTVKDLYYNLIVTHKNTTDEESVRMIEIIMEGRTYDLSTYHYEDLKLVSTTGSSGNLSYGIMFRHLIADKSADIAGFWTANVEQLQIQMENLIAEYNEMASWM